jgi:hypothetical protein
MREVIGNDRVMQFHLGGLLTSIHMSPDLETFGPHSVMRLIEFFRDRLSVQSFWPD